MMMIYCIIGLITSISLAIVWGALHVPACSEDREREDRIEMSFIILIAGMLWPVAIPLILVYLCTSLRVSFKDKTITWSKR